MDARDLLRQYLEQRRELGESEFILDSLTVDDAMRALGVRAAPPETRSRASERPKERAPQSQRPASPSQPPVTPPELRQRDVGGAPDADDWRAALQAAGAAPPPKASQPVAAPVVRTPAAPPPPTTEGPIVIGSASRELFGGPLAGVSSLEGVAKLIAECTGCPLHAIAKNPVPGEGNPNADFVCVGEAPGQTEDETGRPFVGRAGELLTAILAAIQLKREDVFICNVLKHRPPGNRNPAPDEIVACRPFLMRQLDLVKPRVILALGTFAAQTLLETRLSIGKLRGHVHTFYGIPLVVTYHPAALLRNPAWKRPTWEDVKLARRLLDQPTGNA
ncbi:MAG TPA: uracil-DNA glycosylase family protein [Gemmatimonadaceae bacterium]|nr:uracil-DNA glycosylase family protein [Gemmatimonadaceae bacterium]